MNLTKKRIVVLFHSGNCATGVTKYSVDHLARYWREDGHEVVYLFGTKTYVPADIVLLHVDLSVVPDQYLAFAARYPIVLNGHIRDIRKSVVSTQLVDPRQSWTGPVIVKSNCNYGGAPEQSLTPGWLTKHSRAWRTACQAVDRLTGREAITDWTKYRVYDSVKDVPSSFFKRSDVVVERFLPERENGLYHLRMFQVLGDRWTCMRIASPHPVFKASMSVSSEEIEPHSEVYTWRKQFNLDYGKLDYLVHEGRPVLIDVNKTTGASGQVAGAPLQAMRRRIAEGLYSYFA
ncbi:hypothetical protein F6V30_15710 [Oryzomonas sagensis]|uniref:ATP-grasp domain-containing protein n=1 Tax=Oryzomonas sagensis TaxID=2603857 RepID=A0ABQ6TKD4_9BACT|nr:hypothetical protein [Oryzomonas sagensis]KAB0668545.1 hypothetical protein F6V30_15710 [Oryzomonas sagensis]